MSDLPFTPPSVEELALLMAALDALANQMDARNHTDLHRKLRADGHDISWRVFKDWRNGDWSRADRILVLAFTALIAERYPNIVPIGIDNTAILV
jgi:hypothetical protein